MRISDWSSDVCSSDLVRIGGSARLEYDSNIYAQAFGEKDDFRLQFRPYVDLLRKGGALELTARAEGDFRKYFQYEKEDADGGRVAAGQIGRASGRERVGQYVEVMGDGGL